MLAISLITLGLLALAGAVPVQPQATGNLIVEAGKLDLHLLSMAVTKAGLYDTLTTQGPFTLFAPTDEAFMSLPPAVLKELLMNTTLLAEVLKYHVVSGIVKSTSLKNEMLAASLAGPKIRVNIYKDGKVITVTGSEVTMADHMATNGVIHVIDRVMYPIPMGSVVDAVKMNDDLTTLLTAVTTAGLGDVLSGPGPFTVFAPTNAAFDKLPAGTLPKLLKDKAALIKILKYHVVSGTVYSKGLSSGAVQTLNGMSVKVTVTEDGVMVNKAKVVMADASVTNGVVHIIDTVLLPPSDDGSNMGNVMEEAETLGLTSLIMLIKRAGLFDTLAMKGPFTIFAPTNDAIMALPPMVRHMVMRNKTLLAEVLKYHVVSGIVKSTSLKNEMLAASLAGPKIRVNIYKDGKVITVSGSQVTKADQMASNGIIHVIDRVMFPIPFGSVVDVVKMDPELSVLLKAVTAAGLGGVLSGPGPFTVFAPSDSAFKKIPPTQLAKLLANKAALTDVLKYHVVSGTAYSKGLSDNEKVTTLNGQSVMVTLTGGVMINDAKVTFPDVAVTNGVVHIIDTVLMPKMEKDVKDDHSNKANEIN